MYKCDRCGDVVEELDTYQECHHELDECPSVERTDWDCGCGGTYFEVEQCPICGEYFEENQLDYGWCQACLDEQKTPESTLQYIDSDPDFQREFYMNGWFEDWDCRSPEAHDALVELGKKHYQELQELAEEFPCVKEHLEGILAHYLSADMSHFHSWLTENLGVPA